MTELAVRRKLNREAMTPQTVAPVVDPHFKRASEVARAQWLMHDATEAQVRSAFKAMPIKEGLSLLAKARQQTEIAAEVLNQRIGEEAQTETCSACARPLEPGKMWAMQGCDKDPATGTFVPYRYCSVFCVRERNRKTKMPAGASPVAADGSEMGDIR